MSPTRSSAGTRDSKTDGLWQCGTRPRLRIQRHGDRLAPAVQGCEQAVGLEPLGSGSRWDFRSPRRRPRGREVEMRRHWDALLPWSERRERVVVALVSRGTGVPLLPCHGVEGVVLPPLLQALVARLVAAGSPWTCLRRRRAGASSARELTERVTQCPGRGQAKGEVFAWTSPLRAAAWGPASLWGKNVCGPILLSSGASRDPMPATAQTEGRLPNPPENMHSARNPQVAARCIFPLYIAVCISSVLDLRLGRRVFPRGMQTRFFSHPLCHWPHTPQGHGHRPRPLPRRVEVPPLRRFPAGTATTSAPYLQDHLGPQVW